MKKIISTGLILFLLGPISLFSAFSVLAPSVAFADAPPAITTLTVSGYTSNSATLTWQVSSPSVDANAIYDVRYSLSPITSGTFSSANPAQQLTISFANVYSSATTRVYVVNGLNPNATYYFAVESSNGGGIWSPMSNVVSVATPSTPANPGYGGTAQPYSAGSGNQGNTVTLGVPTTGTVSGPSAAGANGAASGNAAPQSSGSGSNYSGLVKCDGVVSDPNTQVPCDFNYFVVTVADLINWGFYIALPIAVVLFAYAGLLYISGVESNIKKARAIFLNAAVGFIIMLIAFTVVHTLIGWFVDPNFGAETLLSK